MSEPQPGLRVEPKVEPRAVSVPRRSGAAGATASRAGLGLLGLGVGLFAWWLITVVLAPAGSLLGRFDPVSAVQALGALMIGGHGLEHVGVTLRRLAVGLGLATLAGVPFGVAVGSSRRLADATGPLFQFTRMISPLAWTPVAIIVFGVGDAPVYFLVAVAAVWPVLLSTAAGVHAIDPGWLRVARSLGASRAEVLRTVTWPGIRAHVVTGLRVALGTAWIVIVPAEMLGVDSGLGYAILDARDRLSYDELTAVILVIGALGFTLDSLAQRLSRAGRPPRPRLGRFTRPRASAATAPPGP